MSLTKRWVVYLHENRVNGKRYIGVTSQKLEKRGKNGLGYAGSPHFYAAIKKYGWDGFRHEILYADLAKEDAERIEVELIAKYRTTDNRYGYNMALGGNTTQGLKISEEGRRNISAAHVGYKQPQHVKDKLKQNNTGTGNPFYGKKHTETAKTANAVAHRGRPVLCVETGEVFVCAVEAARATGIQFGSISACCRHKRHYNTAGGYHWEYVGTPIFDTQNS